MRTKVSSPGYAYLMSRDEYCRTVGGIVDDYGDIRSVEDGKLLCNVKAANVFGLAPYCCTPSSDEGYLCYVHEIKSDDKRANIRFAWIADGECKLMGKTHEDVPLDALYEVLDSSAGSP